MERQPGEANHFRVDDEIRNCLNDILNKTCLLKLVQINQKLRQRPPRKAASGEQATGAFKASLEAQISRAEQQERTNSRTEVRRLVIALGNFHTST